MTARDILYGRRGGGWVDHEPTDWRADMAAIRAAHGLTDEAPADDDGEQLELFS